MTISTDITVTNFAGFQKTKVTDPISASRMERNASKVSQAPTTRVRSDKLHFAFRFCSVWNQPDDQYRHGYCFLQNSIFLSSNLFNFVLFAELASIANIFKAERMRLSLFHAFRNRRTVFWYQLLSMPSVHVKTHLKSKVRKSPRRFAVSIFYCNKLQ